MTNGAVPSERARDPWERQVPGLGRDPEHTPMQWDSSANAGFSPDGTEPWLPVAANYTEVNVAGQADDPSSMLTLTRRLLALRRASPPLSVGTYEPLDGIW